KDNKNGLNAEFFQGTSLNQSIKKRIDPHLDWLWMGSAPDPDVPAQDFSVRWTGWLKVPKTGYYKLITISDDGVRVWLDDDPEPIINDWKGHWATRNEIEVELKAKYYKL